MPFPGSLNNRTGIGILGLPAQHLFGHCGIRNQFWRVARSSLANDGWNLVTGDVSASFNNLSDAKTSSCPEIDFDSFAGFDSLESGKVPVSYTHLTLPTIYSV